LSSDREELRRMADMLRSGATMLAEQCPECYSPLFKVGEEIWCPRCNRRVIKVKAGREETQISTLDTLESLENTVIAKLGELEEQIRAETGLPRLRELGALVSQWIDLLDKIKRLKRA